MTRLPTTYVLAAGARWVSWLAAVLALVASGALVRADRAGYTIAALAFATAYSLVWTVLLPRMLTRIRDGALIILYDLLACFIPMWIDGGWHSPFIALPLSVLVLPVVSRGWRHGLPLAAVFLAIDQIALWSSSPNPWEIASSGSFSNAMLIGRIFLPFGVTFALALIARLVRHLRAPAKQRPSATPPRRDYRTPSPPAGARPIDRSAPFGRSADDDPQPLWSRARTSQPTIERRRPTTIRGSLDHALPELKALGVTVTRDLSGDEQQLAPQTQELLIRALEVAIDNVISHAQARNVSIIVCIEADTATLRVTDDGVGLFDGTAEPPGFRQIKRLRFRTEEIGALLRVDERDQGGVTFELVVPLAS